MKAKKLIKEIFGHGCSVFKNVIISDYILHEGRDSFWSIPRTQQNTCHMVVTNTYTMH